MILLIPSFRDQCRLQHGRLIGGVDAKKCESTHQVLIQRLGGKDYRCGGSIINRLFVLTANHCNVESWMPCEANEAKRNSKEIAQCKRKRDIQTHYNYPDNILGMKLY